MESRCDFGWNFGDFQSNTLIATFAGMPLFDLRTDVWSSQLYDGAGCLCGFVFVSAMHLAGLDASKPAITGLAEVVSAQRVARGVKTTVLGFAMGIQCSMADKSPSTMRTPETGSKAVFRCGDVNRTVFHAVCGIDIPFTALSSHGQSVMFDARAMLQ